MPLSIAFVDAPSIPPTGLNNKKPDARPGFQFCAVKVPVLFQINFLPSPRAHYSPNLAAVDRTLVGGCQAAFHLLQDLI
jgi:hypothetical protein